MKRQGLDGPILIRGRIGGEVHPEKRNNGIQAGAGLFPAPFLAREAKAQGIVVLKEMLHGLPEQLGFEPLPHLQEQGLVEVMGLGRLLIQKPALNGRQRHNTANQPLLRCHACVGQ